MLSLRLLGKFDRQELDLLTNDPIPLNYNFRDIATLKPSGNYSQTFRIPASPNNEDFFQGFFDVNYVGSINPKRKIAAVILEDTVPLMYGHLQIKSVIYQDGKPEYEICFFGETVDLWKDLGTSLLSDLDWTAYDHANSNANIILANAGTLLNGDIRYGIIDRSHNWSTQGEEGTTDLNTEFTPGAFTPFMKCKAILDAIFEDTEYTYDSTFLNTASFTNCFMPLFSANQFPITYNAPSSANFNAGLTSATEVLTQGLGYVSGMSDSGNFFDAGGNFTTGGSNYFTPPWGGVYTVRYWATVEVASGYPPDWEYWFYFGIRNITDGEWVHTVAVSETNNNPLTLDIEVILDPSKNYSLAYYSSDNVQAQFVGGSSPDIVNGTGWEVTNVSYPWGSGTLDIGRNFPKMTKVDFIRGIADMFNLVMVPDKKNPKKILIEPYNDYQGSGDTLDWTKKLDTSKDYAYSPTTDLQKRKYTFEYSKGGDYINTAIQTAELRTYGRFLIDDTENDFSTGELVVNPKFIPYPITAISGTSLIVHKGFDKDLKKLKEAKPMIAYDCGQVPCTPIPCYDALTLTTNIFNTYTHFSNFDTYSPDVSSLDLNFGQDITFYPVSGNPINTLFNTYWRESINQLYSSEARTLEGHFALDAIDINQLKFSDRVWVKDSYWRVERIDGYKSNEGSTKVLLIKILNTSQECEYTPIGTDSTDLSVVFEDGAGTESGGNQTCCELYGYTWSGGVCYNLIGPGGNLPSPSVLTGSSGVSSGSIRASIGYIQGAENSSSAASLFNNINALNTNIADYVTASGIFGEGHDVGGNGRLLGMLVSGRNVKAFESGRHFGGRNESDDQQGLIQSGEILMHVSDTGWTSTTSKNLLLDGSYLDMPDETMWSVHAHIVVEEWVAATPAFVDYKTIIANANWWKDRAAAKAGAWTIQSQTGTLGAFALATDVATDTAQHRLQITYNGTTITNPVKVTCRLTYVQTVE